MIRNNSYNYSVDGGIPRKMDGTPHMMRYALRPFFRGLSIHRKIITVIPLIYTSNWRQLHRDIVATG